MVRPLTPPRPSFVARIRHALRPALVGYLVLAGGVVFALYRGEVSDREKAHAQCVTSNASRREIKDEILFVLETFKTPTSVIEELRQSQEKHLPQREC